MVQQLGESREAWGHDVWAQAEAFGNSMKHEVKPFYIVYACKPDTSNRGVFRQTFRAYYQRPPAIIGILVWYVNHPTGQFEFVPELSSPPDIPVDERLLSDKACDASERVMQQGKQLNVLVS